MNNNDLPEEIVEIRNKILKALKEYPDEMFVAFCSTLYASVQGDHSEFVEGLELNEKDKLNILHGMLNQKVNTSLDTTEDAVNFGNLLLKEFERILKIEKNKKRRKR